MNNTINKIIESIESLSSEEKDLLFEEMEQRKLINKHLQKNQDLINSLELAESDVTNYLANLEDYEDKLAKGEIKW